MKTRELKMEDGGRQTCGERSRPGGRSARPAPNASVAGQTPGMGPGAHPGGARGAGRRARGGRAPGRETWRTLALLLGFCLLQSAFCLRASGQSYAIDWHKIAGGGGTSSGGNYSISGTIGQPDATANGALSGGQYALTGGFWALVSVAQTPGAPTLYISRSGGTVTVYWQAVPGWSLVQSGNLATPIASWSASGIPTLTNGTNYLNVVNAPGNQFFRLKQNP